MNRLRAISTIQVMRQIDDPVRAYDEVAPAFAELTQGRKEYLDAIDRLVIGNLPKTPFSLLDIGAGDGRRARRIAATAGVSKLVLLEPSAGMRAAGNPQTGYLNLRAEQLHRVDGSFDAILCLWNVLGHVFPHSARAEVLHQCQRLLTPGGRLFIDVNHRYNGAHYGWLATVGRYLYDQLRPSERNGDVVATWKLNGRQTSVRGHVFTDREFRSLAGGAGLLVDRRLVVDYRTGQERQWSVQGNLLYVMRRATAPS